MNRGLGRKAPPDWDHVNRYPLTAAHIDELTTPRPVVIGVNWYPEFWRPIKRDLYWWLPEITSHRPAGGHCVCLKPRHATDPVGWWDFYNQHDEGICVGEGVSRLASQLNRKRYQPRWLYDRCKEIDGDPEDGTTVRAGLQVLRSRGHVPARPGEPEYLDAGALDDRQPSAAEGISAYRWARSIDDVLTVLGYADLDFVDVLNSWGRDFPHIVRMSTKTLDRLWYEDGELGVVTDR